MIKWKIDQAHSEIQFRVKHLMIANVTGYFRKFNLEVETESEDFTTVKKILFTADINSIDTNNDQRDTHLKSEDFFAAEKFGQITFEGRTFEHSGNGYQLKGDLTIRNIKRPLTVTVEFSGIVEDPYGQTKAGFSVDGKLSRKEFGLMWNTVTEAGHVVVADEINIHCDVELIKESEMVSA
jgi:polyisoprenoid-binding protein YceI